MEIRADVALPHPRSLVFATYRDDIVELVDLMPNIRSIKVVSRAERPGEIELVNEWIGGGDIPAVARSIMNESMLRWTDHATWFEADFRVAWRTDAHAFQHAVQSAGENRFVETAGGTRFELRGQLTCDASKVPGVPRLLAKTIGGTVEKVMVAAIAKNAIEMARGVGALLARRSAP